MNKKVKKKRGKRFIKDPKIIAELSRISDENGGLLTPEAIVEAASNPRSPLHKKFEWDDSAAAHAFRLMQARKVLEQTVEFLPGNTGAGYDKPVRIYVSLTPDRELEKGGYRNIITVLRNDSLRSQLLRDALDELERIQSKYEMLSELAEVFVAIRKVRKKVK
jgi:hypothetical protein